ncbi:hypothetical protein BH09SUM1_BH09SUM1_30370 [soil metagenome]
MFFANRKFVYPVALAGGAFLALAATQIHSAPVAEYKKGESDFIENGRLKHVHWSQYYLDALAADDVKKVIPTIEKLAFRATSPPLKNALNRLLSEIALEIKDDKAAEGYINKIIDESLPGS